MNLHITYLPLENFGLFSRVVLSTIRLSFVISLSLISFSASESLVSEVTWNAAFLNDLTYLSLTAFDMDKNKERNAPGIARKERRMRSCKREIGARLKPKTKVSIATKTSNPSNFCPGVIKRGD